jgi:hypothetical protein
MDNTKSPVKELKSRNADDLAAWHSIQGDLKKIIGWLSALIDNLQSSNPEENPDPINEALWVAAVVFYARCFHGGIRHSLVPTIYDGLNGDPQGAHQFYMDMRDKRIAHSVNAYEQYKTGMIAAEKDGKWEVTSVMPCLMNHSYPTAEGCTTLLELSKVACNHATAQVKRLLEEVNKEAQALEQEDIKKSINLGFTAPGPTQAGSKRH